MTDAIRPSLRPSARALAAAVAIVAAGALAGCAPGGAAAGAGVGADAPAAAVDADRPLAGLARGGGLVFPVQQLELAAGAAAPAGGSDALLRALDAELDFALSERGLSRVVAGTATAVRLAGSNPTYASDPRALPLSPGRRMEAGDDVGEPLSSQLRAVAALADRRHVVVPLAVRLEPGAADGHVRATLHVALVDVRMARVLWAGATAPAEADRSSGALAPRVAGRFVELLVAPPEP